MNTLQGFSGVDYTRLVHLSRREFLCWLERGLAGLFGLPLLKPGRGEQSIIPMTGGPGVELETPDRGRVVDTTLSVYERASFSARVTAMHARDTVLPIQGVTIGDNYPAHNRVWYLVNGEGYAHSGKVQPVATRSNAPVRSIPHNGLLGEVTVPYSDARRAPDRQARYAARLYYSSVFWILDAVQDAKGGWWYRIPDDRRSILYWARAEHLRVISPEELAPLSPQVPPTEKRLEVHLTRQLAVAYEGDEAVFITRVASGGHFADGDYSTPAGHFMIRHKRPSRHMLSDDLAAPGAFDLPGVPWVCTLTDSGVAFHGTYWHNDYGRPRSHGCLNISPLAARWIYRWTTPSVPYGEHTVDALEGTRVDII